MIYQQEDAVIKFKCVREILEELLAKWKETPQGTAQKFRLSRNDYGQNIIKARIQRGERYYWIFVGLFDQILKSVEMNASPWEQAKESPVPSQKEDLYL